jgi:hypothetical protein
MNHPLPTLHQEAQGIRSTKKSHFASNHFAKTLATKEREERKEKIILPN